MSDQLIREVDEDLRRERYEKIWARYGAYVIGAALAIVVATAAIVGWREYQISERQEQGARFTAAMAEAEAGNLAGAAAEFQALAADAGAGYRTLSLLQVAAARAKQGDAAGAVAVYDQLAADGGADPLLRDLAALLAVLQLMDGGAAGELGERLAPLAAEDRPFRYSARELAALVEAKSGNTEAAKQAFSALADDPEAPSGVRARAAEMLAALGGAG